MPSLLPGFEYDVFISYRHKDNKYDGWVSEFVANLRKELEATFKDDVSIYFDENPHDGLLETHQVDDSLKKKLRSIVFIPIISQTYCDPKSFAWSSEFLGFMKLAQDSPGLKVQLRNGNVTTRVLPVRIHDIDAEDLAMLEHDLGGKLRAIDFTYHSSGVNRPLTAKDQPDHVLNKFFYRDQINKVANSIKEIIIGLKGPGYSMDIEEPHEDQPRYMQFRTEFNKRNILRVCISYLLSAAVLWKITSVGTNLFQVPGIILNVVSLLLIAFFPVAILTAWLYERSPQGFIRAGSDYSFANPYSYDQKKPFTSNIFLTLSLITIVALFLLFPTQANKQVASNHPYDDTSLAVLPFANLSNDPTQEYISDGMMEAILSHLSKIEGLRLTSRTTMMTYKNTKKITPEIAREVGVRFVLEGSILRADNTIRITIQLIDSRDDSHVWSEYYDRKLADLLMIQSEVAQQVAKNLEINVKPTAKIGLDAIPTTNEEAYDLYLKATHIRDIRDSLEQFRSYSEKALKLDPQFWPAYNQLAWYWISQGFGSMDHREVIRNAEPLLNKSLRLNPDDFYAHAWVGFLNLWYKWDYYSAEREFNYARRLNPSDPFTVSTDLYVALGLFPEAVEQAKQSLEFEPNNPQLKVVMGFTLFFDKQLEESLQYCDSAWNLENRPADHSFYGDLARTYLYLEKYERVVELVEESIRLKVVSPRLLGTEAIALIHLGNRDKAKELMLEIEKNVDRAPGGSPAFYLAMIYAQLREIDKAFEYLDVAYKHHEIEMYWIRIEPPFEPLHKDPRWAALLDRVGSPKNDEFE